MFRSSRPASHSCSSELQQNHALRWGATCFGADRCLSAKHRMKKAGEETCGIDQLKTEITFHSNVLCSIPDIWCDDIIHISQYLHNTIYLQIFRGLPLPPSLTLMRPRRNQANFPFLDCSAPQLTNVLVSSIVGAKLICEMSRWHHKTKLRMTRMCGKREVLSLTQRGPLQSSRRRGRMPGHARLQRRPRRSGSGPRSFSLSGL